ncbi:hypothetical protein D3C84_1114590 [compost metagenome]
MNWSNSTISGASSLTKASKLLLLSSIGTSRMPSATRSARCSPGPAGLLKVMSQPCPRNVSRICMICPLAADERGSGQT